MGLASKAKQQGASAPPATDAPMFAMNPAFMQNPVAAPAPAPAADQPAGNNTVMYGNSNAPPAYSPAPAYSPPVAIQPTGPNMFDVVNNVMRSCVAANKLGGFYDESRLVPLVQRIASLDWRSLANKWHLSVEMAVHLSCLSLYDVAMYIDDSGSMSFEESGTRIADMAMIMEKDGIVVRFINSNEHGDGIKCEKDVNDLIKRVKFTGNTMVGTNLRKKVLEPFAYSGSMAKPILVITVTDGDPSGEPRDTLRSVIEQCVEKMAKTSYGPKAVAFEFVQVGRDKRAEGFLNELDDIPTQKGGIIVGDVVDTVSYYENEEEGFKAKGVELTPELYVIKLALGAIDSLFDKMD